MGVRSRPTDFTASPRKTYNPFGNRSDLRSTLSDRSKTPSAQSDTKWPHRSNSSVAGSHTLYMVTPSLSYTCLTRPCSFVSRLYTQSSGQNRQLAAENIPRVFRTDAVMRGLAISPATLANVASSSWFLPFVFAIWLSRFSPGTRGVCRRYLLLTRGAHIFPVCRLFGRRL